MREERDVRVIALVPVHEIRERILPYVHDEHDTELIALCDQTQVHDAGGAEGLQPVVLFGHVPVVELGTGVLFPADVVVPVPAHAGRGCVVEHEIGLEIDHALH